MRSSFLDSFSDLWVARHLSMTGTALIYHEFDCDCNVELTNLDKTKHGHPGDDRRQPSDIQPSLSECQQLSSQPQFPLIFPSRLHVSNRQASCKSYSQWLSHFVNTEVDK